MGYCLNNLCINEFGTLLFFTKQNVEIVVHEHITKTKKKGHDMKLWPTPAGLKLIKGATVRPSY